MTLLSAAAIPARVNIGPWLVHYTFDELASRVERQRVVLPICPLGTEAEELAALGELVLPPLYQEALEPDLKQAMLARIGECFPYLAGTRARAASRCELEVVELPPRRREPPRAKVLAFSVDTAVEQHGPHLPLATDTIQSYAVLRALAGEFDGLVLGSPIDYGHLAWGLPKGLSIDLTPPLTQRYVRAVANALLDWARPEALYVVDVHGSPVHRQAIQDGLRASRVRSWTFRWLYEPMVEFGFERGDQHAGAVETAVIGAISPALWDARWWPARQAELAAGQMSVELALELTPDLPRFVEYAESHPWNGIVGRIEGFAELDGAELLRRSIALARGDVRALCAGG